MSGTLKRPAFAMVGATVMLMLSAASGGAGASRGSSVLVRIESASQKTILARGLEVRVSNKGAGRPIVRVRGSSSAFDVPDFTRLTKTRAVRLRGAKASAPSQRVTVVRLRLTAEGRKQIASCEARTLRVKAAGARDQARLVRDTKQCKPKPVDLSRADRCDFIGEQDGSLCLLPFPDDYYTIADPSTRTGRRIDLKTAAMPQNVTGKPIDAGPYNLNDGFSPGQAILLRVPGLDNPEAFEKTDPVPIGRIGRYAEPHAPIVLIDAHTGERAPIFVEIDSNASEPQSTTLMIQPATNLASGHRYIVALRDFKDADGNTIRAPEGFRYYRDRLPTRRPPIKRRRAHFEGIFDTLRQAGIRRSNLYLAWDFTVASDENIAARVLSMRDDAFGQLGDGDLSNLTVEGHAPAFQVTQVNNFTAGEDARIARQVLGTFTVPCYLQPSCAAGGQFALDPNGLPTENGTWTASFECIIPRVAVDEPGAAPARLSLYGHGLFGSAGEVHAGGQQDLANRHGFVLCATDQIGMSRSDLPFPTVPILNDLSSFPKLADRLQQGLLNELYLGRLMIHPNGFRSDPAFHIDPQDAASASVIDASHLYYDGNSQGGIIGGALTAIAPDFTRAALGVPAMRYSMLLPRSASFDRFASFLYPAYPNELARPLVLSLIQMLWDRGEPNGYAHRMTDDPLPNTPAHKVLMNVAFGDHRVTNWAADIEARTIGSATHAPVLDPGRWPDVNVLWNVPAIQSYPYDGSAILYWDTGPVRPDPNNPSVTIGVPPPPTENRPNRDGEDPHGGPRGAPGALQQVSDFLAPAGAVTDVCGPSPCYAGGWTGPP